MSKPYVYKRPAGKHYRVSIKNWNKVFSKRGLWPFIVANVYVNGDTAIIHYNISIIGNIFLIMFSPLIYIINIFVYGFREANTGFMDEIFDKKRGKFGIDAVYKYSDNTHRTLTGGWLKLRMLVGDNTI